MQTKIGKNDETREGKVKFHFPLMARLNSNLCKTIVMFFKSFQFSSELCLLGESLFKAQGKMKIPIFFDLTNEIYRYRQFL